MCQNGCMARGWESKAVESQIEANQNPNETPGPGSKSDDQVRREKERQDLQLSRIRIVNDLETAKHPNHRKSLEAALAHLDKKLAELK
jgi:hypothetical protein